MCTVYKNITGTFGKIVIILYPGKHSLIVQNDYEGMFVFITACPFYLFGAENIAQEGNHDDLFL